MDDVPTERRETLFHQPVEDGVHDENRELEKLLDDQEKQGQLKKPINFLYEIRYQAITSLPSPRLQFGYLKQL